ncbi:MAG: hypothetical protein Q7S06_03860 [Nanoarchaeota archaeon]|nr:hypothetical protein [Nanoarchaeota archaeon]
MEKKQIVFVEPKPTVIIYRIARTLKLTGKYEVILVTFSKIDKQFYSSAYDKILVLELSHKMDRNFLHTIKDFFNKISSKDGRKFFTDIKKMKPYLFHVTGPDAFSLMTMLFMGNSKKIYYANDIWGMDKRNFFFTKEFWIKGEIQKFSEKVCMRDVDGVINKMSPKEFELLSYKVNAPKMYISPSLLDEWTFAPKKKNGKDIHIVFGGSPHSIWPGKNRYIDAMRVITSQKIHFHTYGECLDKKDGEFFANEAKKNKYYSYHKGIKPNELNREMSQYHYGIFPPFEDMDENSLNEQKILLGAKMLNYLEAGLPIIIDKECEYMRAIIEKYEIGFGVDLNDLKNLRKILEKKDYAQLQRNVKKFQEEFRLNKKIKEMEAFYEKITKSE